ncbi:MAG: glycosyltransferase, partial [Planctomycetes bacterium]|nr:glycosyltransferase [Planctomycetota bacterium]
EMSVLDFVPYGPPFFELLRGYHAVVAPSISDEQPRIIFDAAAQAVPVIASATDGLRPHVKSSQTGWLVEVGCPRNLAETISRLAATPHRLEDCGLRSLAVAQTLTHREMHRVRSHLLAEMIEDRLDSDQGQAE